MCPGCPACECPDLTTCMLVPHMAGNGNGRGTRPGKGRKTSKGKGKGAGVAGAPRGGKGEGKGGGGGRGAPPLSVRSSGAAAAEAPQPQQPAVQLEENRLTSRDSRRDYGRDRRDYGQGQGAGSESGTRPPRTISEQLEAIGIQTFAFGPPPDLERWTPAMLEALRHEDDDPAPRPPPYPPPPPGPPPPRDIDVESESEAEVLLIRGPIGLTDYDGTSLLTDPFPGPIGRMPPPSDLGNSNLPLRAETSKKSSDGHGKTWPGLARPARPWTDLARRGHGQTWRGAAMDRPGQQACLD